MGQSLSFWQFLILALVLAVANMLLVSVIFFVTKENGQQGLAPFHYIPPEAIPRDPPINNASSTTVHGLELSITGLRWVGPAPNLEITYSFRFVPCDREYYWDLREPDEQICVRFWDGLGIPVEPRIWEPIILDSEFADFRVSTCVDKLIVSAPAATKEVSIQLGGSQLRTKKIQLPPGRPLAPGAAGGVRHSGLPLTSHVITVC